MYPLPSLQTLLWRKRGSWWQRARGFVVGLQGRGAGEKPRRPLVPDKYTDTLRPKGGQPALRKLGALGAPPLPFSPAPLRLTLPEDPRLRRRSPHPYSLAVLSRLQRLRLLRLLSNSAGQQLASFVSAGQCPRRLPSSVQRRTPLPQVPPDSVQGRGRTAWELRDPLGSLGRRVC